MSNFLPKLLAVTSKVTRRRASCAWLIALTLASSACGQSEAPPSAGSGTSTELVEGLLDLLAAPKSLESGGTPSDAAKPKITPADLGLDGEDLGEASSANPLNSVRQRMLIAAGYLRKGVTNTQTQQLQANIVERMDDIIKKLEQSPPPDRSPREQQPASAAQRQQVEQRQQQSPASTPPKTTGSDQADPADESGQPNGVPDDSPTARTSRSLTVDLSDPKSLQQSVWGQLPERVRQQMQSRMVEQFLPAYREQIEAYFQALLK